VVTCPIDLKGNVKFNLSKTILMLNFKDKNDQSTVQLIATPAESSRFFEIEEQDSWFVESTFKWSKRENTNLLDTVGSEAIDNRNKVLTNGGTGLSAVISSGVLFKGQIDVDKLFPNIEPTETSSKAAEPLKLPLAIDTEPYLNANPTVGASETDMASASDGTPKKDGGVVDFKISFGPLPPDSIALDDYLKKSAGKTQHALFASACRTATITIMSGKLEGKKFTSVVADPNWVQTVAFPPKGSIKMHSICGVNVLNDTAVASTTGELINAGIAQAKSLIETWKTSKSKAETKKP
jgi:hypothetical protein